MYRKKNDLQCLVTSLTSAEKRHFTIISNAFDSKHSNYARLFNILSNEAGDISAKAPAPEDKQVHSATTGKTLYHNLLKTLRLYYQEASIDMILNNLLCEVEILFLKNLGFQSLTLLDKAKKLAYESERHAVVIQALGWERKLNFILSQPQRSEYEIAIEEEKVSKEMQQVIQLQRLFNRVLEYKRKHGYIRGALRQQLQQEINETGLELYATDTLSEKSRYYAFFTQVLFHWMQYNHHEAFRYSQQLVRIQPGVISEIEYLMALLEHVTSCICLGRFKDALAYLEKAETFKNSLSLKNVVPCTMKLFYYKTCYRLMAYMYMGDKENCRMVIKETEQQLVLLRSHLSNEMEQVINNALRNACLSTGDMDKAEALLNKMVSNPASPLRTDVYDDAILFRLFWHFTREDYSILPHFALSAFRYYKNFKDDQNRFDIELKISSMLRHAKINSLPSEKKRILNQLRSVIIDHISACTTLNRFQEHYYYYVIWIDSIVQRKPFHEVAAAWHEQYKAEYCI
jgi:hypothetical protein